MNNNSTFRSLSSALRLSDSDVLAVFTLSEQLVTAEEVKQWLSPSSDPEFKDMEDIELAIFLNCLIDKNRGKKEGPPTSPEEEITNNIILKKLKIALNFQSEDVKEVLLLADISLSDNELSAFFRKPDHKNYRNCPNPILEGFLRGLQLKLNPT